MYTLQKLQELKNLNINWVSYNEPYISSLGQFSDIVISIMSTLSKIEREKISDRTKAGLRLAKSNGKKLGRPPILCPSGHKMDRTYQSRKAGKTQYLYLCPKCSINLAQLPMQRD